MKNIVIIRQHYYHCSALVKVLRQLRFCKIIDVYSKDHFSINSIDCKGFSNIGFKNIHIDNIDSVLYLGFPYESFATQNYSKNEKFIDSEFYASLITLLHLNQKKMINYALSIKWMHVLENRFEKLLLLNKIGWSIPAVLNTFSISDGNVVTTDEPDASELQKYFLIISRYNYIVSPFYNVKFENQDNFDMIIKCTKKFLCAYNIDWLVIPFTTFNYKFYAYSFDFDMPSKIDNSLLVNFLEEAILC